MTAYIAWENLADAATIVADAAEATLPAVNLRDMHVARVFRSTGLPSYLTVDFGRTVGLDHVALIGVIATATSSFRIRFSEDPTFATGYDSGVLTDRHDVRTKQFLYLFQGTESARYMKIDFDDPSLAVFEAGRLVAGPGFRPETNYLYGWGRGYRNTDRQSKSRGGQTYTDIGASYRVAHLTFDDLTPDEVNGFVSDIDHYNGTNADVLICFDDEADNVAREMIFGLINEPTDVLNNNFELNTKTYSIEERK